MTMSSDTRQDIDNFEIIGIFEIFCNLWNFKVFDIFENFRFFWILTFPKFLKFWIFWNFWNLEIFELCHQMSDLRFPTLVLIHIKDLLNLLTYLNIDIKILMLSQDYITQDESPVTGSIDWGKTIIIKNLKISGYTGRRCQLYYFNWNTVYIII